MLNLTAGTVQTIAGNGELNSDPVAGPALSSPLYAPRGILDPWHTGGSPADVLLYSNMFEVLLRLNRRTGMLSRIALKGVGRLNAMLATPCGWLVACTVANIVAIDPRDGRAADLAGSDERGASRFADGPVMAACFSEIPDLSVDADSRRLVVVRNHSFPAFSRALCLPSHSCVVVACSVSLRARRSVGGPD